MDIKKICINNLGKEIDYGSLKGMVVGYNIVLKCLILSLVEDCGWNDFVSSDIILLHSPLSHIMFLLILNIIKNNLYYERCNRYL